MLIDDFTILFGTGYDQSSQALIEWINQNWVPDVIVIEHADPDHYGALGTLTEHYPSSTVAIHAEDAKQLAQHSISPDVRLQDGDLRWGIRTLHIPGHTPGNSAFLHEPSGTLIAGDTFVHRDSEIASPGNWSGVFAPIHPRFNLSDGAARRNIKRLRDYRFDSVLLTHGTDIEQEVMTHLERLLSDLGLLSPG